jgi:hypothetical protein
MSAMCITWMESITISFGLFFGDHADLLDAGFRQHIQVAGRQAQRCARIATC